MVTYAVVAVLMNACFTVSIDNVLFGKIRAGEIALDLIRPVNLVWYWMTEDVGRSLAAVTQFALPLTAISLLFVDPPLPAGMGAGLLFLPSCALSFLLLWQLYVTRGEFDLMLLRPLEIAFHPVVGVAMLVLALAVFAAGLRRYESAGS